MPRASIAPSLPAERAGRTADDGPAASARRLARAFQDGLGREIEEAMAPESMAPLIEGGFLELDAAGLRATPAGLQRLNAVLAALVV